MTDKELQTIEKKEVNTSSENVRKVLVFVPTVDICESPNELVLFADMPGVPMENVEVDLEGDQLTIRGKSLLHNGNSGTVLLREYNEGDYFRQFKLSQAVDRDKIEATMKDGVLKVVLPKAKAAIPRKIAIKSL